MNSDALLNAQVALRHILAGQAPNGMGSKDYGPYADVISELYQAHAAGGTDVVRRVFKALDKHWRGDLTRLVSGDDLQPETAPALFDTDQWLDIGIVLRALNRGETGDSELLIALYAHRLAFDHIEKSWYLWTGHYWAADRRKQVGNFIANQVAAQYLHAAAKLQAETTDDERKQKLVKDLLIRAGALRSRNRIGNVLALAASQPILSLSGDEWEQSPNFLAVVNGVIDLTGGELRAGCPTDYIRTVAPVAWHGLNTPAPRWERFIEEIFAEDSEMIAFVQRLLGYSIFGKVIEHVLPIFYGPGRNGKDTLLETLRNTLGPIAEPVSTDVLIDRRAGNSGSASPHIYALRWLRLAWASETGVGAKFNIEQVKFLTGGGTITARPLYGGMVTFRPKFLLILLTNHKPRADADDYALWKRLLLIPFTQSFVDDPVAKHEHKADPHLVEKLCEEAPGILAWLVRGCLTYQREGLKPPSCVRLATEEYQQEEDDLNQFIEEFCLVGTGYQVEAGLLYRTYRNWAENYGKLPWGSKNFGSRMTKRFEKRKSSVNFYIGIGLLQS